MNTHTQYHGVYVIRQSPLLDSQKAVGYVGVFLIIQFIKKKKKTL